MLRKNLETFKEISEGEEVQNRPDSETESEAPNENSYTRGQRVEF